MNRFPNNFMWGASTSAYQFEGAAHLDGKKSSQQDIINKLNEEKYGFANAEITSDHYHHFKEDVKLMKEMGLNAYRFSISWPRVLPGGTGKVNENTTQGIFGEYTANINNSKTYDVAEPKEIKKGKAKILTVLNNTEIKEYEINITDINSKKQKNKNFVFEITDKELLDKTNGIIQGMSGSPIIQGDKIIGAVTHVVINNPHKGYGIFITNMLEEAEN